MGGDSDSDSDSETRQDNNSKARLRHNVSHRSSIPWQILSAHEIPTGAAAGESCIGGGSGGGETRLETNQHLRQPQQCYKVSALSAMMT